jgi:hypothetical protein
MIKRVIIKKNYGVKQELLPLQAPLTGFHFVNQFDL